MTYSTSSNINNINIHFTEKIKVYLGSAYLNDSIGSLIPFSFSPLLGFLLLVKKIKKIKKNVHIWVWPDKKSYQWASWHCRVIYFYSSSITLHLLSTTATGEVFLIELYIKPKPILLLGSKDKD